MCHVGCHPAVRALTADGEYHAVELQCPYKHSMRTDGRPCMVMRRYSVRWSGTQIARAVAILAAVVGALVLEQWIPRQSPLPWFVCAILVAMFLRHHGTTGHPRYLLNLTLLLASMRAIEATWLIGIATAVLSWTTIHVGLTLLTLAIVMFLQWPPEPMLATIANIQLLRLIAWVIEYIGIPLVSIVDSGLVYLWTGHLVAYGAMRASETAFSITYRTSMLDAPAPSPPCDVKT